MDKSRSPFVSVIIVNYNGKEFLGECLDSVLESRYPNFEIVVVDNASSDGSFEYLKTAYANNPKIGMVRSDQQLFFTGGCNLGAKEAKGDKIIFLNNDTTVDRNWISELIKLNQGHKKRIIQPKVLKYSKREIIDTAGGIYSFFGIGRSRGNGEKDTGQYNRDERVDYASGTCFMVDKKFFEELGGLDEWYKYHYEDVDLNLRARKFGGESWYCYKSIIYHKGSLTFKDNVRSETLLFNIRKNRLRTATKNFSGLESFVRVSGLFLIYIFLALQDLLTFRPRRMFLTIKSVFGVLDHEYKLLIEKARLWELKSFVKQKKSSLSKRPILPPHPPRRFG